MTFCKRIPLHDWQYLKIKIWSEKPLDVAITELSFRMSIQIALEKIFGQLGASIVVDVLDWDEQIHVGCIKIAQSQLVTLHSALSMYVFQMADKTCTFDILGSSAHLISLADDSRSLRF